MCDPISYFTCLKAAFSRYGGECGRVGSDWCANGDDFVAGSTEVSPGGIIDKDTDKDKNKDKANGDDFVAGSTEVSPGGIIDKDTDKDKNKDKTNSDDFVAGSTEVSPGEGFCFWLQT